MLAVFGSINVDMVFRLQHLPAPGETVLTRRYELLPGGKGANQAAAAAKAGGNVLMIGAIGDDSHGQMMLETLRRAGAHTDTVIKTESPTGIAIIGVDQHGENSIIVASGANLDSRASQLDARVLARVSTVLCQNEVPPEETASALKLAKDADIRTILNMAPAGTLEGETLSAVDVLILNEVEARAVAGDQHTDLAELATAIAARHRLSCVITQGSEGAMVVDESGMTMVPALPVNVVDTTGAGDTFAGALAAMLDEGQSLERATRFAVAAAGLSCQSLGAQTAQPERAAVIEALQSI